MAIIVNKCIKFVPARWASTGRPFLRFAAQSPPFMQALGLLDVVHFNTYSVRMIKFEWGSVKASSNLKKHGISFVEAQSVFYDEFAVQFFDAESSAAEDRFLMLGMSGEAKLLLVCHCEREGGDAIRIISARKATSNERKYYHGGYHEN